MASGKHKNRWLSGQLLGLVRKAEFNSVTQHSVSHSETRQGFRETPQGRHGYSGKLVQQGTSAYSDELDCRSLMKS